MIVSAATYQGDEIGAKIEPFSAQFSSTTQHTQSREETSTFFKANPIITQMMMMIALRCFISLSWRIKWNCCQEVQRWSGSKNLRLRFFFSRLVGSGIMLGLFLEPSSFQPLLFLYEHYIRKKIRTKKENGRHISVDKIGALTCSRKMSVLKKKFRYRGLNSVS